MKRRTIKDDGPDPIDVYVGSRVRARRVGLRISQTKLSDALGVSFQQVQKYENGSNRLGAANLFKASKALGVPVEFFFEGLEPGSEITEIVGIQDLDKHDIELIADLAKIGNPGNKDIRLLVKGLAREHVG